MNTTNKNKAIKQISKLRRRLTSEEFEAFMSNVYYQSSLSFLLNETKGNELTPSGIICNAFVWSKTRQGDEYWNKIWNKLVNIELNII